MLKFYSIVFCTLLVETISSHGDQLVIDVDFHEFSFKPDSGIQCDNFLITIENTGSCIVNISVPLTNHYAAALVNDKEKDKTGVIVAASIIGTAGSAAVAYLGAKYIMNMLQSNSYRINDAGGAQFVEL